MGEIHEQAKRLADAAERLIAESERLRRDVRDLKERVRPGMDGRFDAPRDLVFWPPPKEVKTFSDMFKKLDAARRNIGDAEREITALRAYMAGILDDAVSREEMKPWLIETPPRKPGR